mgnify:CR=1 FL=1
MDIASRISTLAKNAGGSGIRRVFDLAVKLKDPINLSIGQPDFPVPDSIKDAAIDAIRGARNGYTPTQGIPPLRERLIAHIERDLGWKVGADDAAPAMIVTSGTSGGLMLAAMSLLDPGDEMIVPDPYFVLYPFLGQLAHAKAVPCDTYPDFRLTAERVAPLITERTKAVLLCSPGNPSGVVSTRRDCEELLKLCRERGIVLISDEIYDEFAFSDATTDVAAGDASWKRCPSPARLPGAQDSVLLIRGFGKTYGITGWRMGYAAGPKPLIDAMQRLQQYTYVCAPTPFQYGSIAALDVDMAPIVAEYETRRDMVVSRLREVTEVTTPGGAFYAFVKIPERMKMTGAQFFEKAAEQKVLVVPGGTFSRRDTHFRLSFATARPQLEKGLELLVGLMR